MFLYVQGLVLNTYLPCPVLLKIKSCPYLMIKILTLHYFELGEFVTSALLSSINSIVMHSCNLITKYSVCQLFDSVYLQVIFRGVSSYRKMIRAMGSLSGEITQSMWSQSKQVIKCACAPEQFGLKLCFYCYSKAKTSEWQEKKIVQTFHDL